MTHTPPTPEAARPEMEIFISPHDRIKLGDNEFAICGEISLANQGIYLLDVGFSADKQGRFGPYDIDGSGQKRTFEKPYVLVTRMHGGGDDEGEGKAKGEIRTFEFDPEEEIVIGRRGEVAEALGLISNEYISRRHATLKVDKR